jgi:hypothetical protein
MDVKEGHPGSILYWFFDTNQATDNLAQILIMFHGSGHAITQFNEACLRRQAEFDHALGPEVLLAFFNPNVSSRRMSDDATRIRRGIRNQEPARFLFAGMGEAYPIPDSLTLVGRGDFRSERPGEHYFEKMSGEIAKANARAVPFFQEAFQLGSGQNYLLIAHRKERVVLTFEVGEDRFISVEEVLALIKPLRQIARHSRGPEDLVAIGTVATASINRSEIIRAVKVLWSTIRPTIKSLPWQ